MIIIEKVLDLESNLMTNLKDIKSPSDYLFIDIETTGFSSVHNSIFLVGCIFYLDEQFHLIQWLCEKESDEYELLYRFSQFIKSFKYLIHYNGTSFDIPFIKRRMSLYNIFHCMKELDSIDLYVELKSFNHYLNFISLKLKAVEKRYGFNRLDTLDGKKIIVLYKEMLLNPTAIVSEQLLCHNKEDLLGLFYCLKAFESINFFKACRNQSLNIKDLSIKLTRTNLILSMPFPLNFQAEINHIICKINITLSQISISLPISYTVLNHYFSDYKNYYYLPLEDRVIHKSVGQFVDKVYRTNVSKENCYIKKRGTFIPLSKNVKTNFPIFKHDLKDSQNYVELTESLLNDYDVIYQMFKSILYNL